MFELGPGLTIWMYHCKSLVASTFLNEYGQELWRLWRPTCLETAGLNNPTPSRRERRETLSTRITLCRKANWATVQYFPEAPQKPSKAAAPRFWVELMPELLEVEKVREKAKQRSRAGTWGRKLELERSAHEHKTPLHSSPKSFTHLIELGPGLTIWIYHCKSASTFLNKYGQDNPL